MSRHAGTWCGNRTNGIREPNAPTRFYNEPCRPFMTSPVRRFLAIFLICLLPLQSMLALATPACGVLPDAGMQDEHHTHPGLNGMDEQLAHALSHQLGAHHHAQHDGDTRSDRGSGASEGGGAKVPCPHGGVHHAQGDDHSDDSSGQDADQADCDGALHCMGSHLVSLLPAHPTRSLVPDGLELPVPGASTAFRSALTEPLHRPPIHAA